MKKLIVFSFVFFFAGIFQISCSNKTKAISSTTSMNSEKTGEPAMTLPPCIIYKTKADYSTLVPVILSDDKMKISSYPDVTDIQKQGKNVYPVELANGFLLDNRGIGPNVAFLDITYDDYLKYTATPPAEELFKQILDADPMLEMYQCGNRYEYEEMVVELNQLIEGELFSNCKKLK